MGRNESPWDVGGAEGMHKGYAGGPVVGHPQGATGVPRPSPSTDPHHKSPEPRRSQQVYCQRQSTGEARPAGPTSGPGGAGGVAARSWGMLRSRPGLLGCVFPPTSLGPRSIRPPGLGPP